MTETKKFLLIQTAFIGDVILTTPMIDLIKKKFDTAEIDFMTIPSSENVIQTNPNLNNLIIFDKKGKDRGFFGLQRMGKFISGREYDVCISPHRSFRSAYLAKRTGAKIRIGFDRSAWQGAYNHIIPYRNDLHEIERNLSLLSVFGIPGHLIPPVIYADNADQNKVKNALEQFGLNNKENLFAVAPGSVWPTKRWPEEYYTKFCKLINEKGIKIVLVGGDKDKNLCERIAACCKETYSLAGSLTLRQTYSLLKKCQGILTNDSAPLHLGMAAGINVFAIFGPTVPAFGFAPFGEKSLVLEIKDLPCRPCAIHGGNKCPIKTFDCMKKQDPEHIFQKVISQLSGPKYKTIF